MRKVKELSLDRLVELIEDNIPDPRRPGGNIRHILVDLFVIMNTDPYGIQQKNRFKNDEISVNYSEQEAKDKCLRDKYTVGKKIEKGRLSGDRLEDGPCKGGCKVFTFFA